MVAASPAGSLHVPKATHGMPRYLVARAVAKFVAAVSAVPLSACPVWWLSISTSTFAAMQAAMNWSTTPESCPGTLYASFVTKRTKLIFGNSALTAAK